MKWLHWNGNLRFFLQKLTDRYPNTENLARQHPQTGAEILDFDYFFDAVIRSVDGNHGAGLAVVAKIVCRSVIAGCVASGEKYAAAVRMDFCAVQLHQSV